MPHGSTDRKFHKPYTSEDCQMCQTDQAKVGTVHAFDVTFLHRLTPAVSNCCARRQTKGNCILTLVGTYTLMLSHLCFEDCVCMITFDQFYSNKSLFSVRGLHGVILLKAFHHSLILFLPFAFVCTFFFPFRCPFLFLLFLLNTICIIPSFSIIWPNACST